MDRIQYNDGYKYQLKQDYALSVPLKPAARFDSDFLLLETDGRLLIKQGYAWDGPSGPTIDTLNFMRGSLVHDALYQLMREDCLDHIQDRAVADQLLRAICIADGMWRLRAWWVYQGVRWFGNPYADPACKRRPIWAPRKYVQRTSADQSR